MNTFTAARLVATREVKVKLRDRTFIFSTVFLLLVAIAVTVLPALLGGGPVTVAAVDRAAATALTEAGMQVRVVADDATAEQLVRAGDVDAAVVAGPRILAMVEAPGEVVGALSTAPPVRLLAPPTVDPFAAFIVPFAIAMIFFITSFTFGLQIAQSVTEEKQTRIVEILVASVPARALLAGKVAAMTLLAFAQIVAIGLVAFAGLTIADTDTQLLELLAPAIGWFIPFFLVGFVMLATLWAGVGALVSRQEDLGGASAPLQMAVMAPFVAVIVLSDNTAAMQVLSYIPLSSPIAMPIRLFNGEAAGWEPVLSVALLAVTAVVLLAVGSRLYEGSLLRTNGRTSVRTAWRSRSTAT